MTLPLPPRALVLPFFRRPAKGFVARRLSLLPALCSAILSAALADCVTHFSSMNLFGKKKTEAPPPQRAQLFEEIKEKPNLLPPPSLPVICAF